MTNNSKKTPAAKKTSNKRIDVALPCKCCGKRLGTTDKVAYWENDNIVGYAHVSCVSAKEGVQS